MVRHTADSSSRDADEPAGVPRLLGVEKSAVAQWERGAKRPSGPALRLLEVLDPEKPDSPVVQVRRSLTRM
jgi:hypothetical protein